jgi:hypothetical protein
MNSPLHKPGHPSAVEQDIAVAIVLWIMLGGICVLVANAWAAGVIPTV